MKPSIQPQPGCTHNLVTGEAVIAAGLTERGIEFAVHHGLLPATAAGYRLHRAMRICARLLEQSTDNDFVDAIEQLVSELPVLIKNARAGQRTNCSCEKCRRARGEQPLQPTTH